MIKRKKWILGLGTVAAVVIPVVSVVACGGTRDTTVTYTKERIANDPTHFAYFRIIKTGKNGFGDGDTTKKPISYPEYKAKSYRPSVD